MPGWRIAVAVIMATSAAIGTDQAITDTIFSYSPPKTGYFGLSPMAFVPADSFVANNYSIVPIDKIIAPAGGCFNAPVNLPHGATITKFIAWYSANGSQTGQFRIFRSRVTDGVADTVAVIDLNNVDSGGARNQVIRDPIASNATVNNALYVYGAYVCLGSGGILFNAARLTYTYTQAGD